MAQFDVYRNTGRHRDHIPFVVVVQSSIFDDYKRRIVVPLVKRASLGKVDSPHLNPTFRIANTIVVLHPLEVVSVPTANLGKPVASLAERGDVIIEALDAMFSRAWK